MKTESWVPMAQMLKVVELLLARLGEEIGGHSDGWNAAVSVRRYRDPDADFIISGHIPVEIPGDRSDLDKLIYKNGIPLGGVNNVQILWFEDKPIAISDQNPLAPEWIYDRIRALFVLEALADI